MKTFAPIALALACAVAAPAHSQTAQTTPKTKPPAKAAAKKPAPKPADPPLPTANDEQKAAASLAHLGDYACEFDQVVNVAPDAKHEGYLDLKFKSQSWVMKPVLSSTGALRLEDVKGRMLMIQIANKSMVMDTQLGQRVVDGCQSDKQREFAKTMEAPQPGALLKQ